MSQTGEKYFVKLIKFGTSMKLTCNCVHICKNLFDFFSI